MRPSAVRNHHDISPCHEQVATLRYHTQRNTRDNCESNFTFIVKINIGVDTRDHSKSMAAVASPDCSANRRQPSHTLS